ncbi:RraA family protein [Streptomyces mayteni]
MTDENPPAHPPELLTEPSSALVSDALDLLGLRDQCLVPDITPLHPGHTLVGRAFPLLARPADAPEPSSPYEGLLRAVDATEVGDVVVFATGNSTAAGVWGELVTAACRTRGVVGALTDGLVRDARQLAAGDFPVFSRGTVPYDSKGRLDVVAHGTPVDIGGVRVRPGDLVVADVDGVVIVPRERVPEVAAAVRDKRAAEGAFRAAVLSGVSMRDAFRTHGVL